MQPRPLNTRSDAIDVITGRGKTTACNRAIQEGRVLVLGGFTPPEDFPYIGFEITGTYGTIWRYKLEINELDHQYYFRECPVFDWKYWSGDESHSLVFKGDIPDILQRRRQESLDEI